MYIKSYYLKFVNIVPVFILNGRSLCFKLRKEGRFKNKGELKK